MSYLGRDDGYQALASVRANAETKVADAHRRAPHVDAGRWPTAGTLLRVFGIAIVAIVVIAWIPAALNAK